MTTPPARVLGIIGHGTVGAELAAQAVRVGVPLRLLVPDPATATRLTRDHQGADLAADAVRVSSDVSVLTDADIVIEAVPERLDDKVAALREADRVCRPDTVFATTTTSLSVRRMAEASGRADRVAGFHPVPFPGPGRLVELVPSALTGPTVLCELERLAWLLGRTAIRTGDRPGRISAQLLFGFLNGAAAMYGQGHASADVIDTAMRLGCGMKSGPLETIDRIGVDTLRAALEELASATGNPWLRPAPVLERLAAEGRLGRKSGRGFHTYRSAAADGPDTEPRPAEPVAAHRIAVVGSGTMAIGIAEVCARSGFRTTLIARSADKAERARSTAAASLMRASVRGRIPAGVGRAAIALLDTAVGLPAAAEADVVIEAVAEDLDVKREVFRELGRVCRPGALLATSTSSLSVADLAAASGRPADVVGVHFFNPAPVMRLVEIVTTPETGATALDTAQTLVTALGKEGVRCADRPGFVVNALLFPYLNQAVEMLSSHYADIDTIDTVLRDGCGFPMGPFQLLDVVGLDVSVQIQQVLHQAAPDTCAEPAALLTHLVRTGLTGRKAGAGFRLHDSAAPKSEVKAHAHA
jgi:3-hydroxybutyryl-CoA dehydrogenase